MHLYSALTVLYVASSSIEIHIFNSIEFQRFCFSSPIPLPTYTGPVLVHYRPLWISTGPVLVVYIMLLGNISPEAVACSVRLWLVHGIKPFSVGFKSADSVLMTSISRGKFSIPCYIGNVYSIHVMTIYTSQFL